MHTHQERVNMMHERAAHKEMVRRGIAHDHPGPRKMYAKRRHRYPRGRRRRGRIPSLCSLGPEKKFHEMAYSADPISTTWAVLSHASGDSLNLVAQGLTESTRVGRRICIHNINMKYILHVPAATSLTAMHQSVRLALVLDTQTNGAIAPSDTVWQFDAAGFVSFRNLENARRYKILWIKTHVFNPSIAGGDTTNDSATQMRIGSFSVKKEVNIEYSADTGALTEVRTNNLFLMGVSSNSAPAAVLTGRVRIRFLD